MANWAELPVDLLVQIANRVKVIEDFIALRAVCTSWAATNGSFDVFSPQVPLLMFGAKDDKYREFYSLSRKKVSRVLLREARGRDCVPSEGWLCTITYKGEMNLLHPFSRAQIQLPSLKSLLASHGQKKIPKRKKEPIMEKAVLSASPSVTSDYVLMVSIFAKQHNYLAFWRSGDLNWTPISTKTWGEITSIVYYNSQFYCVSCHGQVWVFDIAGSSIPQSIVNSRFLVWLEGTFHRRKRFCLVKLSGALLIITRISNGVRGSRPNFRFKVSELDVIRGESNEISNLGDSAIFLSRDGASSINCFRFPGVKPNHIYFTDDSCKKYKCLVGERSMREYNIEDEKIESLYPGLSSFRPLTWVTPSF